MRKLHRVERNRKLNFQFFASARQKPVTIRFFLRYLFTIFPEIIENLIEKGKQQKKKKQQEKEIKKCTSFYRVSRNPKYMFIHLYISLATFFFLFDG